MNKKATTKTAPRKTKTKAQPLPNASAALRKLRGRLEETQAAMADRLGVSILTVTIWENRRPPSGIVLIRLAALAESLGFSDLAMVFEGELEKLPRPIREDLNRERERQRQIEMRLSQLKDIAGLLIEQRKTIGASILGCVEGLEEALMESRDWAWRNQR